MAAACSNCHGPCHLTSGSLCEICTQFATLHVCFGGLPVEQAPDRIRFQFDLPPTASQVINFHRTDYQYGDKLLQV